MGESTYVVVVVMWKERAIRREWWKCERGHRIPPIPKASLSLLLQEHALYTKIGWEGSRKRWVIYHKERVPLGEVGIPSSDSPNIHIKLNRWIQEKVIASPSPSIVFPTRGTFFPLLLLHAIGSSLFSITSSFSFIYITYLFFNYTSFLKLFFIR